MEKNNNQPILSKKYKSLLKKRPVRWLITAILVLATVISGYKYISTKKPAAIHAFNGNDPAGRQRGRRLQITGYNEKTVSVFYPEA